MRLFIGYTPPGEIQEQLTGWLESIRRSNLPFRWPEEVGFHLTLHFLGEVGTPLQNRLVDILDEVLKGVNAFPLEIDRLGAFMHKKSVRILWAGIRANSYLNELHQRLRHVLKGIGLCSDERPFSPHITLARPRKDAEAIPMSALKNHLCTPKPLKCSFDHLTLFSSQLTPQGARHNKQKEYHFA